MSTLGDPVGRALMNRDAPNTVRIPEVDFAFDVFGDTMQELGERAADVARRFYGDKQFRIKSMSVQEAPDHGLYGARVWSELA